MDKFVFEIGGIVEETRCPQVANIAEEEIFVAECNGPDTNVEFSLFVKEWSLYVFLNDPTGVKVVITDASFDLVQSIENFDSSSLVIISRFYDPQILLKLFCR